MLRRVSRVHLDAFLDACGFAKRDLFRVEVDLHEVRGFYYDRLDDGNKYLGPDGVATRVETVLMDPLSASLDAGMHAVGDALRGALRDGLRVSGDGA